MSAIIVDNFQIRIKFNKFFDKLLIGMMNESKEEQLDFLYLMIGAIAFLIILV